MELDERINWIESRILLSIKSNHSLLKAFFKNSKNRNRLIDFINKRDLRFLHISQLHSGELSLSYQLNIRAIGKCICFIKYPHINRIQRNNINHSVFSLEFNNQIAIVLFEHILKHLYMPVVISYEDDRIIMLLQEILNEAYSICDTITAIDNYNFKLTPLISNRSLFLKPIKFVKLSEKVVTSWIKIIDKYTTLSHKLTYHTKNDNCNYYNSTQLSSTIMIDRRTVICELEYWNSAVFRLQTVETSLTSDTSSFILSHLEQYNSSLEYQIRLTMQEISIALLNAREVLLYLRPLGNWIRQLTSLTSVDSQVRIISPICRLLFLIWDNSTHYQSTTHFYILLQQVIELIINLSNNKIEDAILTNPKTSLIGIKQALLLSTTFRGNYVDYKAKADQILFDKKTKYFFDTDGNPIGDIVLEELPPFSRLELSGKLKQKQSRTVKICKWPARNSSMFITFSKNIDRYKDVLELLQTIVGFGDLRCIVGNSNKEKLNTVDDSILFLFKKFQAAVQPFRDMERNLFSFNEEFGFVSKFFTFRLQMKEIESNLSKILISQVFTTHNNFSVFRKIQLFRGTLSRYSVLTKLKGTLDNAMNIIYCDLQTIGRMISNPHYLNFYLSDSLSVRFFYRAVHARLYTSYYQINYINTDLCSGDLKWSIRNEYSQLTQVVNNRLNMIKVTLTDISFIFTSPLLIFDNTGLCVNMPHEVLQTVHEVYYSRIFKEDSITVQLRQQVSRFKRLHLSTASNTLQHICIAFNELERNKNEAYSILFTDEINRTRTRLYNGINRITWESVELVNFLQHSKSEICDTIMPKLIRSKQLLDSIQSIINCWSDLPLDVFSTEIKTNLIESCTNNNNNGNNNNNINNSDDDDDDYNKNNNNCDDDDDNCWINKYDNSTKCYKGVDELINDHKSLESEFEYALFHSYIKISSLIDSFYREVQISSNSPNWQNYLEQIDSLLLKGLYKTTLKSFSSIQHCILENSINCNNSSLLICIKLNLSGNGITYIPSLEPATQVPCLSELVTEWTNSYTQRCVNMKPFSFSSQDFFCKLRHDTSFHVTTKTLMNILKSNFKECDLLLEVFDSYSYLWVEDIQTSFKSFVSGHIQPTVKNITRSETIRSCASMSSHLTAHSSILGLSEIKFLYPENNNLNESLKLTQLDKKLPSLDDFDTQISIYYDTYKYLKSIPRYNNIGLISVNTKPIVEFLLTLCFKWIFIYCDFLQSRVELVISEISKFIAFISPQLEKITGQENDIEDLSKVMLVFHHMVQKQSEFEFKFTPLQRCISLLSNFKYSLHDGDQAAFKVISHNWELLKTSYRMAKQRIRPQILSISDKLEDDLKKFQQEIDKLDEKFNQSDLFNFDCPLKDAKEFLEEFHKELVKLDHFSHELIEFQDLLECSYVNFGKLELINLKLNLLVQVWFLADEIFSNEKNLKRIMWQKLECGNISVKLEYLMRQLSNLPQETHKWEITQCLLALLEDMNSCLPLLELLNCQALRERHWKQLLRVVPKPRVGSAIITEISMLTKLSFGKLHKLGLHKHMAEVEAIIIKAEEEVDIEYLLKRFEECWISRVFEFDTLIPSMDIHDPLLEINKPPKVFSEKRDSNMASLSISSSDSLTTSSSPKKFRTLNMFGSRSSGINNMGTLEPPNTQPISLLTGIEDLFREIDDDLFEIERVLSSSTSISFIEELKQWQTKFQRIDTVMRLWITLQVTWVGLIEVFNWNEMRSQMIQEATNFMNVDKQWRNIVKEARNDANIIRFCLKKDAMISLEEIQLNLERCRKSLLKHFENAHHRFPRFFFLSTNDILMIICQGNDPRLLSNYMYKLFPGIYTLYLSPLSKSVVLGVTSFAGSQLTFERGVICERKVEKNLIRFCEQLRETLTCQYTRIKQSNLNLISSESFQLYNIGIAIVKRILRGDCTSSEIHFLAVKLLLTNLLEEYVASSNYEQLQLLLTGINSGIEYIFNILQDDSKLFRRAKAKEVTTLISSNMSLTSLPFSKELNTPLLRFPNTEIPFAENTTENDNTTQLNDSNISKTQSEAIPLDISRENIASDASSLYESIMVAILIDNLLILFVYYKELLGKLAFKQELKLRDTFEWFTTIKFKSYTDQEQKCVLELADVQINYGFEYQGDFKEIIITPSTQKCILSLVQAMKIASGSSISGLQCSGKMATLKEFSYLAGRPFFEVCCTEQTNKEIIYKHFQGLTHSNSILCFRYINKLNLDVLSVMVEAIKKFSYKHLTGSMSSITNNTTVPNTISPISYGACFATLQHGQFNTSQHKLTVINQIFKNYTLVPDLIIIIEILIYTHRFYFLQEITNKLYKFYQLYNALFDDSCHSRNKTSYLSLFKLRHIIFVAAEKLRGFKSKFVQPKQKQESRVDRIPTYTNRRRSIAVSITTPINLTSPAKNMSNRPVSAEENSDKLHSSTISKTELLSLEMSAISSTLKEYFFNLLTTDTAESLNHKCKTVVDSLFPNSDKETDSVKEDKRLLKSSISLIPSNSMLTNYSDRVSKIISSLELDPSPTFIAKVSEVWNSLKIHHMVCILGPCSSGKSSALKVCSSFFLDQRQTSIHHTILPQALHIDMLFGNLNVNSSTLDTGILPNLFKVLFKGPLSEEIKSHYWFILDGELHETHCDVLSTIDFEDNSICIPCQNKTKLYPNTRIILESLSSDYLTPSLAAKLGFVYFSKSTIDWENIANSWLFNHHTKNNSKKYNNENHSIWNTLIWKYLPLAIHVISPDPKFDSIFKSKVGSSTYRLFIKSKINLSMPIAIVSMAISFFAVLDSLLGKGKNISYEMSEILVNFSAVWSIGGCLGNSSRDLFNTLWRECFNGKNCFPKQHTVWHYIPDYENECFTLPSLKGVDNSKVSLVKDGVPFIPTIQSQCFMYVIESLHYTKTPILISGKLGCGKSSAIVYYLSSLKHKDYEQRSLIRIRCNMSSRSCDILETVQKELIWKFGNVYVPKDNKKLDYVIEDLNYPNCNAFYSLPEALRWLLSFNGCYDFKTGIWKSMESIYCIATCNSDLSKLSSRLLKHFFALEYHYPDVPTQVTIFQTILSLYFICSEIEYYDVKRLISLPLLTSIVAITVELQYNLTSIFLITKARTLYNFSLRDLETLFRRLCIVLDCQPSTQNFITLWNHELYWIYYQRLSSSNDKKIFITEKNKLFNKYLINFNYIQPYVVEYKPHSLLSDKLLIDTNAISMTDYIINTDYSKLHDFITRFMDSCSAPPFCSKFKLPLYNSVIDILNRLCFYFVNPTDISNVILIGNNQNYILVTLAASLLGFSVGYIRDNMASNSVNNKFSDNLKICPKSLDTISFDHYIKDYYIQAGLKNKKSVIFITHNDLKCHDILFRVFEFADHCYITHLFSLEQQGNIVNGLRSFISQKGRDFTEEVAWETFLENVQKNLRYVICLDFSDLKIIQFSNLVPNFFNRMQIINILPWNRSELIDVTKYFLTNNDYSAREIMTDCKIIDKMSYMLATLHLDTRSSLSFKQSCLPGNDSFQQFTIKFLQELNLKLSDRNYTQQELLSSLNKLEQYKTRKIDYNKELDTNKCYINETNDSCFMYTSLIGQQTAIIDQNVVYTKRQLERIKYLKDLLPKVDNAYTLAVVLRGNHLENINDVIKLIDRKDLITLKLIDEPDQTIITFINVLVNIFKPSEDVPSWPRGIRRLLSNVDRFLHMLENFHLTSIKFQDSTILKIEEMLTQEAFTVEDLNKNYNSFLPILPLLVHWISTIYYYHKVDVGKVQHIHSQLKVIKANIISLEDSYAQSIKKIESQKDIRHSLYKSLYNSTVALSTSKSLYYSIETEASEHDQFLESLGVLPVSWKSGSEVNQLEMDSFIASLVVAVGYICYISRYPIENQLTLLLHVWPETLRNLGINLDWHLALSNVLETPMKLSPNIQFSKILNSITFGSNFLLVIKVLHFILSKKSLSVYYLPFCSTFSYLTEFFVNCVALRWSSFDYSSPFPLDLYLNGDNTHYFTANITSSTFNIMRDALSKGSTCVIKNTRQGLEPILSSLAELPYQTSKENNKSMYIQIAGRTVTYNRDFKMFLTRITPSSCAFENIIPEIYHLNLSPNPLLLKEVLCHKFLTKHCLYEIWHRGFSLISNKISEFLSIHTSLIARMTGEEINQEFSSKSNRKLPHNEVSQLMPFFNSKSHSIETYTYFSTSVLSVVSQLERLCNTAALIVCFLSSIQELDECYHFNFNILYTIAETVFSEFKLYFIQPTNLTNYPKFKFGPSTTTPTPPSTLTPTPTHEHMNSGDVKTFFQEQFIWPDPSFFPDENNSPDISDAVDRAQIEFLRNCNITYKKFLKHEHQIFFVSFISLATTFQKCNIDYSIILINAFLDLLLLRVLTSENAMGKFERPEWIQEQVWVQILALPLSDTCCSTLYTSITDHHVEWQAWINNGESSFKQFPIPISMNGLVQSNCFLYSEAVLIIQAFYPYSIINNLRQLIFDTICQESPLEKQCSISNILTSTDPSTTDTKIYFFVQENRQYNHTNSNTYTSCFLSLSLFERELIYFSKHNDFNFKSFNLIDCKSVTYLTEEDKNLNYIFIKNFEFNFELLHDLLNGILSQLMQKGTKIILLGEWRKEYETLYTHHISIIPIENILPQYCLQTIDNDAFIFEDINCVALALLNTLPAELQRQLIIKDAIMFLPVHLVLVHAYLLTINILTSSENNILHTALNLLMNKSQLSHTISIESVLIDVYGLSQPLHKTIPNLSTILTANNLTELSQCFLNNILSDIYYTDMKLTYSSLFLNILKYKLIPFDENTRPLVVYDLHRSFSHYDKSLPISLTQLKENLEKCINLLPKSIQPLTPNYIYKIYPLHRYIIEDELVQVRILLLEVNTILRQIIEHLSTGFSTCSQSLMDIAKDIYYSCVPYVWKSKYSVSSSNLMTWLTQLCSHNEALLRYQNDTLKEVLRLDLFNNPERVINSLLEENKTLSQNIIIIIPIELDNINENGSHKAFNDNSYESLEVIISVYNSIVDHSLCLIANTTIEKSLPINVKLKPIQLDCLDNAGVNIELNMEKLPLKNHSCSQSIISYVYCTAQTYSYIFPPP